MDSTFRVLTEAWSLFRARIRYPIKHRVHPVPPPVA
jgi:hypothetical protein